MAFLNLWGDKSIWKHSSRKKQRLASNEQGYKDYAESEEQKGHNLAKDLFGDKEKLKGNRNFVYGELEKRAKGGGTRAGQIASGQAQSSALSSARSTMGARGLRGGTAIQSVAANQRLAAETLQEQYKINAQKDLFSASSNDLSAFYTLPLAYKSAAVGENAAKREQYAANNQKTGILSKSIGWLF